MKLKQHFKSAVAATSLCLMTANTLADYTNPSAQRVPLLDKMTFALSPNQKLDGPAFYNTERGRNKYGTTYLKTLLQEGHKIGKQYLNQGDKKGYYTFMMTALAVPLHEGLLDRIY